MKMFKIYPLSFLFLLTFALLSCSKDKDKEGPSNLIDDAFGLSIDLTWSTGGTTMTAKTEADLDLYIMKGTTEVVVSDRIGGFESLEFSSSLADGDYLVNVEYFEGSKNVSCELTITGKASGKIYKMNSDMVASSSGSVNVDLLKITKIGNKFTINSINKL